jgi:hypothetical protein
MRPVEARTRPLVADRFIAESMASSCDDLVELPGLVWKGIAGLVRCIKALPQGFRRRLVRVPSGQAVRKS